MNRPFLIGLILMALTFGFLHAAAAEVVDRIVAQVNEEIITLYDVEAAMIPFLIQQGENPSRLRNERFRKEVFEATLETMVDRILLEQEAKRLEVDIPEARIEAFLRETRQSQGLSEEQFRQAIGQYGIDMETYRQIIRDNMIQSTVLQARARTGAISEAEVDSIYRRRFGQTAGEQYVEVRHILLIPDAATGGLDGAKERAMDLKARIEAGESFAELAEEYSQGPGSNRGGFLGQFRRGQLQASFEQVIFSMEEGELRAPVETDFGVHIVEVLSIEVREDANVEQRKNQIRAMLQEREMERQMRTVMQTLRTRAFIDIRL